MTIEEAIFSKLTGEAAVTNLVGTRVYPFQMPQNPIYPAVVYSRVSTRRDMDHSGPGDMAWARFQFDCYGTSYASVKGLANVVRQVLHGFTGTVSGVDFCRVSFLNEVDDFEPQAEIHWVAVDFQIIHKE